jgi:hypothetical protein
VVIKNNLIVSKQNEAAFRFDKGPDNPVYINNQVYASKLTDHRGNVQLTEISGVAFSTSFPNLTPNEQGLMLKAGIGAKDLRVLDVNSTGITW